jgi:hypothetical protein
MANRVKILAAVSVAALALVAAGCGGSSSTSASGSTSATSGRGPAASSAFRACLAKQGVKLPSGFGNGRPPQGGAGQAPQGGTPPSFGAKQQKAFAACRSKLPAGASASGGFPGGGQNNPAVTKYTTCLRKHGVTFGGSNNQSAFKKASAACAKYAPTPGG